MSGAWTVTACRHFVWDGWLMLLEIDGEWDAVLRTYTWGLDLSRDREGAGGIGGLLSVEDATVPGGPGEYVYFYDANGNVGQLVDWADIADWQQKGLSGPADWHADRLVARYEYDPYGNRTNEPAQGEPEQPFQFSTHQFDPETGLLYAKNRYYSPRLGRWLTRDPIGEAGGRHLYAYVFNAPPTLVDPMGLFIWYYRTCTPWKPVDKPYFVLRSTEYALRVTVTLPTSGGWLDLASEIASQFGVGGQLIDWKPLKSLDAYDNRIHQVQRNAYIPCRCQWDKWQKHERDCCSAWGIANWSSTAKCWTDRDRKRVGNTTTYGVVVNVPRSIEVTCQCVNPNAPRPNLTVPFPAYLSVDSFSSGGVR